MKLDSKNLFITSDTHFGHTNICKGISKWDWKKNPSSVRDFETLSQMNDRIVNNINSKVGHDDVLIHVGDWSFGGFENIENFRSRLTCQNIILITGNHDHHVKTNRGGVQKLFSHVSKMEEIEIDKKLVVFCHHPVDHWMDSEKGSYMLHGHLHSIGEKRFSPGRKMDVGIDGSPDFAPYHINEIFAILEKRFTPKPRH